MRRARKGDSSLVSTRSISFVRKGEPKKGKGRGEKGQERAVPLVELETQAKHS